MARDTKVWRCGRFELRFDRPRIMGVLHATPESFSDEEGDFDSDAAIAYGMQLLDDGADIVEIIGESPHASHLSFSADEEAHRVLPVARALSQSGAVLCITTRYVDVAKAAVRVGAAIVNDTTGFTDPRMIDFLKQSTCGVIVTQAGETAEEPETSRTEVQLDTSAAAYAAERARAAAEVEKEDAAKGKRGGRSKRTGTLTQGQGQLPFNASPNGSEAVGKASEEQDADEVVEDADAMSEELSGTQIELSAAAIVAEEEAAASGNGSERSGTARSARRDTAYVSTSQLRRFTLPDSAPIMRRVMGFLSDQARMLIRSGVDRERICLNPGTGFGKDVNEDIVILRETGKIASLGYPLLCSMSSERFAAALSGSGKGKFSDAVSYGASLGAIEQGANIVCVRDVAGFTQFLNGFWAVEHPQPRRAFVSLESNMGRRLDNLRAARDLIAEIPMTCVSNCSHIYESEPATEVAQEPYACAVIEIKTELAPLILLDELLKVEDKLGRNRTKSARPGGPRVIDCDLIWMDNEVHGGKKLQLPHPGLGERDFVLVPIEDLMHNPARFFRFEGVDVKEPEERVGHVTGELGSF